MKYLMMITALFLAACSADVSTADGEQAKPAQEPVPAKEETVKPKQAKFEMKVSGMMCEHCQATVTKLITDVPGVESAKVDYKTGLATVTTKPGANLTESSLREAVEKDYAVESIHAVAQ